MRIKYKGKTIFPNLTHNKIYDVVSIEKKWYRVVDDSGEDYIYAPEQFDIIDNDNKNVIIIDDNLSKSEIKEAKIKIKEKLGI